MGVIRRYRRHWLASVVLALAACTAAPPADRVVWRLEGETNSIFLLGSMHLLREADYPLPAAFQAAYANADKLVMELDMDDLEPTLIRRAMLEAGLIDDGTTLQQWLGDAAWEQALSDAAELDFDLAQMQRAEPWLVALTIVEAQMLTLGYNPALGIESHFTAQARRDGKPIDGLESIGEQIEVFDRLPRATQQRFLLKTIGDARALGSEMPGLVEAWRRGNHSELEAQLVQSFDGFPEVYRGLVVERNLRWAGHIEELLDDDEDYLVVVGALHLVGKDSLIEILRQRGHRIAPY